MNDIIEQRGYFRCKTCGYLSASVNKGACNIPNQVLTHSFEPVKLRIESVNETDDAFVTKPCETCGVPVPDRNDPTFAGKWSCYDCHCKAVGRDPKKTLNALATIIKGIVPKTPEFEHPNKGFFYICVGCALPIEHRGMCKGCSNAYDIGRKQLAIDILSFGKPELRELMKKFINGERA